ncbi:MAG: hypothetical protein ACMUIP_15310 [bacterium]
MRDKTEHEKEKQMIDSRHIAERLGVRHSSFFNCILQYRHKFEEFGMLYIRNDRNERFALLSEAQALFLRINVLLFLI